MIKIALSPNDRQLRQNDYSIKEEEEIYDNLLQDIIENPRWYLNNVTYLSSFYVSWKNYKYTSPVIPYRFVREKKLKLEKQHSL